MPTSQFTIYTGNDYQGPGLITGTTGSLINILDYVLVGGYGTGSYYKAPAGWTKPFPNSGSTSTPSFGCYRQGGGSSCSLFVNDSCLMSVAGGREAWITGWEFISSVGPTSSGSTNVGQGTNQFPLPAQEQTYGYVVVRKNDTTSSLASSGRYWVIAADATTMYMWIWAESADLNRCYHWMFGDIYSLAGASDVWKCSIYGRVINNGPSGQITSVLRDYTELIPGGTFVNNTVAAQITIAQPGHYLLRNGFGTGTSLNYTKHGDAQFGPYASLSTLSVPAWNPMYGIMQPVNGADNISYIVPLEVIEPSTTYVRLRGRLRGLYHPPCHYLNYSNGQLISGSGDYAGRTFMVIRYSYINSVWLVETSPTVETN